MPHNLAFRRSIDSCRLDYLGIDFLHVGKKEYKIHTSVHPQDYKEHWQHRNIVLAQEGRRPSGCKKICQPIEDFLQRLPVIRSQELGQFFHWVGKKRPPFRTNHLKDSGGNLLGGSIATRRREKLAQLTLKPCPRHRVHHFGYRPMW